MEKALWSIDFDQWDFNDTSKFQIEGWAVTKDGRDVEIQVVSEDDQPIPCEICTRKRADVQETMTQIDFQGNPGFGVLFYDVFQLKEQHQELRIYLIADGEKILAYHKTFEEICKAYYAATMYCNLDWLRKKGNTMIVYGWVYNKEGTEKIVVRDDDGNEIPCGMKRTRRSDVAKQLGLADEEYHYGFELYVPRDRVKTPHLQVHVNNEWVEKVLTVDMKKYDFDNTKPGKFLNTLGPSKFKDNKQYIKDFGIRHFRYHAITEMNFGVTEYDIVERDHRLSEKQLQAQRKTKFRYNPKFSIVIPLYNTPIKYLKVIIDSILEQTYGNLQLCLADGSTDDVVNDYIKQNYSQDSRVCYKKLEKNLGISENTNAALELADGDFIMLSDHDDIVAPNALYEMVKAMNENPAIDVLYTDEDKVDMDGKRYCDPHYKPDFNIDLLRSNNYICHIFVVKKKIVDKIGKFRSEFDGAQDYDFILRCCENAKCIHHIPEVLYHWRSHPQSTAGNPDSKKYAYLAGCDVVAAHYERVGLKAKVTMTPNWGRYRSQFEVEGNPLVSIVIPNKDHVRELKKCLESVFQKSTYKNYEIVIMENNSTEAETFAYYKEMEAAHENLKVVYWKDEFNYSAINNQGVRETSGEYIVFLNNDIEVISEDWLEEMLGYAQREDVGAVGARLYYADDTIQHTGVIIGLGRDHTAGHVLSRFPRYDFSYVGKAESTQDLSAVTAACMMVKKKDFQIVGGFDEELKVSYNDVDLCLKLREAGKLVVYNAFIEMYHYESISRGYEETRGKSAQFKKEVKLFRKKWKKQIDAGDPYYNKNLTLRKGDCTFR